MLFIISKVKLTLNERKSVAHFAFALFVLFAKVFVFYLIKDL